MKYRSKWTRHNVLQFIDENYPEVSFKIMGMTYRSKPVQVGNFSHNKYGRLFAQKIRIKRDRVTLTTFRTEHHSHSNPSKGIKAFMNEWVKKSRNKL